MGINLTQAANLAAVFQVENLEIGLAPVVDVKEVPEGKGGLTLSKGEARRVFDLGRIKHLSREDRAICYEALVRLRKAGSSKDFDLDNQAPSKIDDAKITEITGKIWADVEEEKELTKWHEKTAASIASFWNGFLNLIRLRVSTERLGEEIERYRSGAKVGQLRMDELEGSEGLIQKTLREVEDVADRRRKIFFDKFWKRNRLVVEIDQLDKQNQASRDLKAKYPTTEKLDQELRIDTFSHSVFSALCYQDEAVLKDFEPLLQKVAFAALVRMQKSFIVSPYLEEEAKLLKKAASSSSSSSSSEEILATTLSLKERKYTKDEGQLLNQEEIRQEFQKLKALFKEEEEKTFKAITDECNEALRKKASHIEEANLLAFKYNDFKPAERPPIVVPFDPEDSDGDVLSEKSGEDSDEDLDRLSKRIEIEEDLLKLLDRVEI